MRFSSSSSPPTSSYVICCPVVPFLVFSFLGESLRTICVPPVTSTGPEGTVETTENVDLFPISAMLGTMISVPATSGLAMRPLRNMSSMPFSNLMVLPSGMFGARTTCSAISGSHFLTETFSSTLTPALVLVSPSMNIMPFPSSSGSHLNTLATTDLLPTISMACGTPCLSLRGRTRPRTASGPCRP